MNWLWVDAAVVDAIHDQTIADHGGHGGVRNKGMIESALFRAPNLTHYGQPDAAALAAAYAFGLAQHHGYVDGNKRVAWTVARVFLADNGCTLRFTPADAVRMMEQLAAGTLHEEALADWFRQRIA